MCCIQFLISRIMIIHRAIKKNDSVEKDIVYCHYQGVKISYFCFWMVWMILLPKVKLSFTILNEWKLKLFAYYIGYWLIQAIPYLFQVIYSSYWNLEKNLFTQIETEACSICIYASHEWMERKLYERQTKLSCQFACRSCDFVSLQITSRYQRSCQKLFFNNKCNLQSRHPKLLR